MGEENYVGLCSSMLTADKDSRTTKEVVRNFGSLIYQYMRKRPIWKTLV